MKRPGSIVQGKVSLCPHSAVNTALKQILDCHAGSVRTLYVDGAKGFVVAPGCRERGVEGTSIVRASAAASPVLQREARLVHAQFFAFGSSSPY